MSVLNFAWGSHLNIIRYVQMIGGEPVTAQNAKLNGFGITASSLERFPPEGADLAGDGGAPRLIASPDNTVYGVLYEISDEQWQRLDHYELAWGFEAFENEVEVASGKKILAKIHNLVEHGDFKAPSAAFLDTMKMGYEQRGYSEEIIQSALQSMTQESP